LTSSSRKKYDSDDLTEWTELTINIESASGLCVSNKTTALEALDITKVKHQASLKAEMI